jgi:RNA recognition motif-containing protein
MLLCLRFVSISAQVIFRGTRSAGYGFVAFNTAEAAQKAVELLNKKELDGRTLIVEVAKPTEEKQKEKKEKRTPKKRSAKKAKASGEEADAASGTADATETKDTVVNGETTGDAKPKKKRNTVSPVSYSNDFLTY